MFVVIILDRIIILGKCYGMVNCYHFLANEIDFQLNSCGKISCSRWNDEQLLLKISYLPSVLYPSGSLDCYCKLWCLVGNVSCSWTKEALGLWILRRCTLYIGGDLNPYCCQTLSSLFGWLLGFPVSVVQLHRLPPLPPPPPVIVCVLFECARAS